MRLKYIYLWNFTAKNTLNANFTANMTVIMLILQNEMLAIWVRKIKANVSAFS